MARRLEAGWSIAFGEEDQASTGSDCQGGPWTRADQSGNKVIGLGTDSTAPVEVVLEGLFREGAMMRWHVLWQRRLAAIGRTDMQGDPTVLMDEMDRRRGNSDIELLGDKLVGDAVKVTFHRDVIVQLYPECVNRFETLLRKI